jgi:hypothetical protein
MLREIICQNFGYLEEMDKFLETCNPPRLIPVEIESLNRPTTNKDTEVITKNSQQRSTQYQISLC